MRKCYFAFNYHKISEIDISILHHVVSTSFHGSNKVFIPFNIRLLNIQVYFAIYNCDFVHDIDKNYGKSQHHYILFVVYQKGSDCKPADIKLKHYRDLPKAPLRLPSPIIDEDMPPPKPTPSSTPIHNYGAKFHVSEQKAKQDDHDQSNAGQYCNKLKKSVDIPT